MVLGVANYLEPARRNSDGISRRPNYARSPVTGTGCGQRERTAASEFMSTLRNDGTASRLQAGVVVGRDLRVC